MAQDQSKKRRLRKNSGTLRQRSQQSSSSESKNPRRLKKTIGTVTRPFGVARRIGGKAYFLPLPDTKWGRFLNKRRRLIPKYFRESWQELRQVTWPGRKETWKLSLAVFIFAIIFGLLVSAIDYGLDKLFRELLLR